MGTARAKQIVLVSLLVMSAYAVGRDLLHPSSIAKGSTYRQLWAIGALGIALALIADLTPEIAGPFAVLVVLAFVVGGDKTITKVAQKAIGYDFSANAPTPSKSGAGPTGPVTPAHPGGIYG